MSRSKVSHEDFVVAWMTSEEPAQVAAETGMSLAAVKQRAVQLRKVGVDLPKRRKPALDRLRVAQLNSLIIKYKGDKS